MVSFWNGFAIGTHFKVLNIEIKNKNPLKKDLFTIIELKIFLPINKR